MVAMLLDSSEKLRPKHLDLKFQRKRRIRANQTASRAWFVPGDLWVAGGAAQSDAAPSIFFDQVCLKAYDQSRHIHMDPGLALFVPWFVCDDFWIWAKSKAAVHPLWYCFQSDSCRLTTIR